MEPVATISIVHVWLEHNWSYSSKQWELLLSSLIYGTEFYSSRPHCPGNIAKSIL